MKTMFAPLWQKRDQSPDHLINVTIRYVETNRFFSPPSGGKLVTINVFTSNPIRHYRTNQK